MAKKITVKKGTSHKPTAKAYDDTKIKALIIKVETGLVKKLDAVHKEIQRLKDRLAKSEAKHSTTKAAAPKKAAPTKKKAAPKKTVKKKKSAKPAHTLEIAAE